MSTAKNLRLGARRLAQILGAIALASVGLAQQFWPFDAWTEDRNYDVLLRSRPAIDVQPIEVVIVDMDQESERVLKQPSVLAWNRGLHAQLVDRLSALGASVIAFDVLFRSSSDDPTPEDAEFLRAIRAHGRVLFGAVSQPRLSPAGQVVGLEIHRPFAKELPIEQAGLVEQAFGADQIIRRHMGAAQRLPSLAWRVAELTLADPPGEPSAERWVNYYGRPLTAIPHVSFHRVLSNTFPASLNFTNKVVFVGARTLIGPTGGSGTDSLPTPFRELMPGVEINATTYLNLRRGDWLWRWPRSAEAACLALWGVTLGFAMIGRPPLKALGLAVLSSLLFSVVALSLVWLFQFWFPWLIALEAQLPLAAAAAVLVYPSLHRQAQMPPPPVAEGRPTVADEGATVIEAHVVPAPAPVPPLVPTPGAAPATPLPAIPDHTVLRCIGRGAYGQVWLARDVIGSFHAVKLVYRNSFERDAPFEREFRGIQKFTPISRQHAGWVHILHVGRNDADGYFFYIMEAGDDESSGQEIDPNTYRPRSLATDLERHRRLPLAECLRIGIALADALDYLHGQLLVHRDIKPSNVIFVHGEPKFADVGMVTGVQNREKAVSWIGTAGYIAPEGPGTAVADLFSLGRLLYELWTGCDRFEYPAVPSSVVEGAAPEAERAMADLLEKLCQEDSRSRPQSAAELKDALEHVRRLMEAQRIDHG